MTKRRHKLVLLFIGSYALIVFCLSLHFIYRSYQSFNETNVIYVQTSNNYYKVVQHKPKIRWCQQLKFVQNTTDRPLIALVSFPGSGNTWLRYLLQQATGVLTGSVYKDYGLLWNGLYGESVMNKSVSVVKTHEWGPSIRDTFDKVILLIRSPGPAIQAEFNRQSGGHLGYASIDRFTRNEGREWANFVMKKLDIWSNMNLDWLINYNKSMFVVYYEHMVREPKRTIESIISFIGLNTDQNHLRCMMRRKEGIYKRRKPYLRFNLFSGELNATLERQWNRIRTEVNNRRNARENELK